MTNLRFEELHIGPILFREEAVFRREIKFEDRIKVDVEVMRATPDFSRWSIRHRFFKDEDSICAVINLDGAWMDILKRKLTVPVEAIRVAFDDFPKAAEFQWKEPGARTTAA